MCLVGGGWWGASTLNDHFLTVPPSTLSLPPSFLQFPLYQRECVCKKKGVGSGSELVTSGGCHSSKNRTAGCWVAWRARGSPGSFSHNASKRVRKKIHAFTFLPSWTIGSSFLARTVGCWKSTSARLHRELPSPLKILQRGVSCSCRCSTAEMYTSYLQFCTSTPPHTPLPSSLLLYPRCYSRKWRALRLEIPRQQ